MELHLIGFNRNGIEKEDTGNQKCVKELNLFTFPSQVVTNCTDFELEEEKANMSFRMSPYPTLLQQKIPCHPGAPDLGFHDLTNSVSAEFNTSQ